MTELESYSGHSEGRDKAILAMRRRGLSPDRIAEELGMKDEFEVRDRLNDIYTELNARKPHGFRPNISETVDYVDNQIDDMVTVFREMALMGDYKAASLVLKAVELKAKVHGAISAPQVNIQVTQERPWETVYKTAMRPAEENERRNTIDGEVSEHANEISVYGDSTDDSVRPYEDN